MNKILLGSNYYPEDWDEAQIDIDLKKMQETGFNVVRIAEFAWHNMEPSEGQFDFKWLHNVVDKCKAAGIYVIMGTPTATPPNWLYNKYPSMAVLKPDGLRTNHGGRRHCCSSNPDYNRYSARIVEALAKEFGRDENVIGWQIDNEIYPNKPCCCEYCAENFHRRLREKYGTVENINKAWNHNVFSQAYDRIEDIPVPAGGWHNPHIKLEWELSQAENHLEFVHMQAEIIKKYSDKPIGTDTMPVNGFNYRKLNSKLDVAQFNHYSQPDYFPTMLFWMSYMSKFSKIPFWNTETQATWNGATAPGMYVFKDNFVYMNTWITYMLGGSANLYWLWRTHWAGHELGHGAVIDSSGRYTHTHEEILRVGAELKKAEKLLLDTKVKSDAAILFQSINWTMQLTQDVNTAIKKNAGEVYDFYDKMLQSGINPDVIDAEEPLDNYKMLVSPFAFTLEEGDFEARVTKWVRDGGTWVVGPLTDIRTSIGTKYKEAPYGFLEKLTGIRQLYIMPDDNGSFTCVNELGETVKCQKTYEIFDDCGGEKLITVKNGHRAVIGRACALEVSVGKGRVIVLGTVPEDNELKRIFRKAAEHAGIKKDDISGGVILTRRTGESYNGIIAADVYGTGGTYRFEGRKKDVLTDKIYDGCIELEPYTLAILAEI